MKKLGLILSLLICSTLIAGCNTTKDISQFSICEEKAKNLNCESRFVRDGIIESGDESILYGMRYSINKSGEFTSDEAIECGFDNKGNLLGVHKNGRVLTPNNIANSDMMKAGGYLYKNLDLTKKEDESEYEELQKDKNMILKYQTDTSASVNKFIDIIHDDLLESCEQYGTGYETRKGTMYERDVCVDNYISDLYNKIKIELNNPRQRYLGDDPVLLSYYNDLNGDHPFVRYFVDLYTEIIDGLGDYGPLPEYPNIAPIVENPYGGYWNDEEKGSEIAEKYGTGFYTYGRGNINADDIERNNIGTIASGIVINGQMLDWIQSEYGYTFPIFKNDIAYGTSPMYGPILLHIKDKYGRDFIYQILGAGGGSGEFHLIVRMLENGIWIPVGQCGANYGFVLFPRYPILFGYDEKQGICEKRKQFDPLTIFIQEYNFYEGNSIEDMADNFTFFLRLLESTRVLSK